MLYPPIAPFRRGLLDAGDGHQLYWEMSGNPRGVHALFLHGGPGGGCTDTSRRWFDPRHYCIVTFDQRGCGRSMPLAGIQSNTTQHLLADIETLRRALEVDRWVVMGRSWGAALAIAYAEQHPARVVAMLLSAIFTARQCELDWLYQGGAARLFPEAWSRFLAPIAEADRGRVIAAYHARLTCGEPAVERAAARAWCAWEDAITTFVPGRGIMDDDALRARARIESHYFAHGAFLPEGELLANAHRLSGIPGVLVQGRYDAVTPPVTAWQLHRAWPGSTLQIVSDAGHASTDPGIMRALIDASDAFTAFTSARTPRARCV